MLPAVRTSAGCRVGATGSGGKEMSTVAVGPVQCTGCLTVLAGLVRGAKIEDVRPHLQVGGKLMFIGNVFDQKPLRKWGGENTCVHCGLIF